MKRILIFILMLSAISQAVSVITAYLESPTILVITDISDAENPKVIRYRKLEKPAEYVLVDNMVVYVVHEKSIESFVVDENGEVSKFGEKEFPFRISGFDVKGGKVVVSYDGTVYVLDGRFKILGSVSTKWNIQQMVFFDPDHVLLNLGEDGIGFVEVKNPEDPRVLWRLEAKFEKVVDVRVKDENVFGLCESGMLFVMDLSDPKKPKVVKYTYLPEQIVKGIVYENYLVVFSTSKRIVVVDVSDPFEPRLLFVKKLGTDVRDVDVVFGNLYVSKRVGVYVYRITKFGLDFVNYVPAMNVSLFARKRVSPPQKMPPGKILWSYSVLSEVRSSPATDGKRIYFASVNGSIFSLDFAGKFLWSYRARFLITAPPVVVNGTVYIGSWDNYLYAVDEEGNLVWRVKLGGDVTRSVVVDRKRVYAGAEDGYLYAIEDGKIVWKKRLDGWMTTNPILFGDGKVVFGTSSGKVYAFSYAGNVLWSFESSGWISSGMAVDGDGNLYFGTTDGKLYSISSKGERRWVYDVGSEISSGPVIDSRGRLIFGTKEGKIYSMDLKGNLMWVREMESEITSHPSVSAEGFLFFGCEDGYMYSLNPDGTIRWKVSTGGKITSSPLVLKGKVIFGSTDGKLYAVYESTSGLDSGPWPTCCGNERHMKVAK